MKYQIAVSIVFFIAMLLLRKCNPVVHITMAGCYVFVMLLLIFSEKRKKKKKTFRFS